jgi:hypothetical protein
VITETSMTVNEHAHVDGWHLYVHAECWATLWRMGCEVGAVVIASKVNQTPNQHAVRKVGVGRVNVQPYIMYASHTVV